MSSRRLPVYVLLDTSGSMKGEPIQAVNVGVKAMVSALKQDPYALESVHLCLITFDIEARELVSLTPLEDISVPEITTPESGATMLGSALELVIQCFESEVIRTTAERKGDWRPLLFVLAPAAIRDDGWQTCGHPGLSECGPRRQATQFRQHRRLRGRAKGEARIPA